MPGSRLRILHVTPTYLPAYRYGGPIESVHALNKYLTGAGAEVVVYTTAVDGPLDLNVPMDRPVDVDGVKVSYFTPGWPRGWFYSPNLRRALSGTARNFDIIHETSVFLSTSFLAARAAARAARPLIISPRGALMREPLRKKALKKKLYLALFEKRNLAAADIHFTSAIEKQEYDDLRLPRRNSLVIPNGLDTSRLPAGDGRRFRDRHNISSRQKVVLFLGRLSWKKGLDTLVEAFAALAKEAPEALLVIAGGDDEGYRAKVEGWIAEKGLRGKAMFLGEVRAGEKSDAYAAADVFVLTSYAENFGNSVAEAMHFKVPVVVTGAVGIAPAVREAEAGFVVKKDVLEVKFALFKLLQSAALRKTMGENGHRLIQEKFSYAAVADRFLEAYAQSIAAYRDSDPGRRSPGHFSP